MAQCAAPKTSDTIRESSRLRDRECPRPTGLSVDSLLRSNKGNGNGGNSVRKGESFTPPTAGLTTLNTVVNFFLVPVAGAARR